MEINNEELQKDIDDFLDRLEERGEFDDFSNFIDNMMKISALSFLTFNLFSIPCFNTIITMKKELGSLRKLILALLFQLIIAFLISTIIYQIGMIIW